MKSSFFFTALIFCEEIKGLIVIGTFYFNGALLSETLCYMQQVTSIKNPNETFTLSHKISALKIKWLVMPTTAYVHKHKIE